MGKTADALDGRCRAAWLKSSGGRGGKAVENSATSVAFLTITLKLMDISNDLRPTQIAPDLTAPGGYTARFTPPGSGFRIA